MSSKWTGEEEHLLRLLLPTNSCQEIAEEFARRCSKELPGFVTERSSEAIRKKCVRDNLTPDVAAEYEDPYQNHFERIKAITAEHRLDAIVVKTGLVDNISRKILSLSDLHFPFTRDDLLEGILEEHSNADVVVINGDLIDGYAFSTFTKSKRIPALVEYRAALEFIQHLSENFPQVVLVEGNHDVRVSRALGRANMQIEETQVLRPNLIARIANGEELDEFGTVVKLHDFKNVLYQAKESWYVQIGKTIFAHPHGFKSGPGGTVYKLDEVLSNRFGTDAYDSIVIGHTHKVSKGIYHNRMLIEQGALCSTLGYEYKADLRFAHAMNGYCVIYQDEDGNTDFNASGPIYLGSALPLKKSIIS